MPALVGRILPADAAAATITVFDLGVPITATAKTDDGASGGGDAEEIQIAGSSEVSFTQDHFGAGSDGSGGLLVDEASALILGNGGSMADQGSLDIIGLTSSGTLILNSDAGFASPNVIVGADKDASGEVDVTSAMLNDTLADAFRHRYAGFGSANDDEAVALVS